MPFRSILILKIQTIESYPITSHSTPFHPLPPIQTNLKGHEGLYSIYVYSLPSYTTNFSPSSVFYRKQIPSQVAEWGMMSMCDAERRLLANGLLDISTWLWYNLRLSLAFSSQPP